MPLQLAELLYYTPEERRAAERLPIDSPERKSLLAAKLAERRAGTGSTYGTSIDGGAQPAPRKEGTRMATPIAPQIAPPRYAPPTPEATGQDSETGTETGHGTGQGTGHGIGAAESREQADDFVIEKERN